MAYQPMRVSLRLPHSNCAASPKAIKQVAQTAEELGFYAVSCQDHVVLDPNAVPCTGGDGDNRDIYECLQVLGWVAGATERIKLLTSIVVLSFRHPVMLAKEASTLDVLSGGRLMLGVGVGAQRNREADQGFKLSSHAMVARQEYDSLGISGHRGEQADECLQVLNVLWTATPASFEGRYYRFEELEFFPKPLQKPRPPLLVGGRADAALSRAALLADGWMPSHVSRKYYAFGRQRAVDIAREAGKPEPSTWGVNIDICTGPNDQEARETMERFFGSSYESPEALRNATLSGSPESILQQLGEWRKLGVNLVDLKIAPRDLDSTLAQMRLIAREIIPALPDLG